MRMLKSRTTSRNVSTENSQVVRFIRKKAGTRTNARKARKLRKRRLVQTDRPRVEVRGSFPTTSDSESCVGGKCGEELLFMERAKLDYRIAAARRS